MIMKVCVVCVTVDQFIHIRLVAQPFESVSEVLYIRLDNSRLLLSSMV